MRLFELCGEDKNLSFSPFVWRTKMALAHKALSYENIPCNFIDKAAFAQSGSKTVPVIEDDGKWISDSWDIACYLEDNYKDKPSLFGGDAGRGVSCFLNSWAAPSLIYPMFCVLAPDIPQHLTPKDAEYFRASRERFFGHPIDDLIDQRQTKLEQFKNSISPIRATLKAQEFISGNAPAYGDYIVFGAYQWARQIGSIDLLEGEKRIAPWFEKMLDLYDGLGRNAPLANSE
jgi:glutathione S-transferase